MSTTRSPSTLLRRLIGLVFASGLTLIPAPRAPGQCVPRWSEAFGAPSISGSGFTGPMGIFDPGSGARLYAAAAAASDHGSIMQWNGVAWSAVPFLPTWASGPQPPVPLTFLAFDDGSGPALYAGFPGIATTTNGITVNGVGRWNGAAWTQVGPGLNGTVRALCVFDDGTGPALYAGGTFGSTGSGTAATVLNSIAKWTGTAWVDIGQGIFGDVFALRSWNSGAGPGLYAGGVFTFTGMGAASNVARWDGTTWSPLGAGIQGTTATVRDMVVHDDGTGPALVVGGFFTAAGASPASNVARWNGTAWSQVGAGIPGAGGIAGLAAWSDGGGPALFAFGPTSTLASGVMRYQAGAWSVPGSGFGPAQGYAGLVYDDGTGPLLHATTSNLTGTGAMGIMGVARWNGSSWLPLAGNGINGEIRCFASGDVAGGHALFAGGSIGYAGGTPVGSGVASFAQGQWHALGTGVSGLSQALTIFDDGTGPALYAGGVSSAVSRWNGSSWSNLPGGISGGTSGFGLATQVRCFANYVDNGMPKLIVGGNFSTAGGILADSIASWDGAAWSGFGGGPGVEVRALAVGDLGLGPRLFAWARIFNGSAYSNSGVVVERVGSSWTSIATTVGAAGAGFSYGDALVVFDDGTGPALFLGVSQTTLNGSPASAVMKWNGSTWSSYGPAGVTSARHLAVLDDGGGPALFATTSNPSLTVMKLVSPGVWTPAGGSFLPTSSIGVEAIIGHDDGSGPALYAGGYFTSVGGTASAGIAKWSTPRPELELFQSGPGGPLSVRDSWLLKSHEYYNVFSDALCAGPPGSGPYLGLCAPNPSLLIAEFNLPLGSIPIHFAAPIGTMTFGGYQLPAGLALDAVCFDWSGGVLGCSSRVIRITVQ